jgi:hypothetical protein
MGESQFRVSSLSTLNEESHGPPSGVSSINDSVLTNVDLLGW